MFEKRMALLEGAKYGMAFGSGMAAMFASLGALVKAGDRVVASLALFGSCLYVIQDLLPRYGVTPVLVDGDKRSILHYEHAFTVYGEILQNLADRADGALMIVADTGHVIFDSRTQIPIERKGDLEARDDYFASFDLAGLDLAGNRFRRAAGLADIGRGQNPLLAL